MKSIYKTMTDKLGFHVRVAGDFCNVVSKFKSDAKIVFKGETYSTKRVLGIISAGIKLNDKFEVVVVGEDEEECVAAIEVFLGELE